MAEMDWKWGTEEGRERVSLSGRHRCAKHTLGSGCWGEAHGLCHVVPGPLKAHIMA